MNTLETISKELISALKPVTTAFSSADNFKQFIYRLGWQADNIPSSYQTLINKVNDAVNAVNALSATPTAPEIAGLFVKIKDVYDAINAISDAPPGVTDTTAYLNEIKERLFELLVVDYLVNSQPTVYNLARMLRIIEPEHTAAGTGRPSFIRNRIYWDRIPDIVTDPGSLPETVYGWGTTAPDYDRIAHHLYSLFNALKIKAQVATPDTTTNTSYCDITDEDDPDNPQIKFQILLPFTHLFINGKFYRVGLSILDLPSIDGKLPGIIIQPDIPSELTSTINITDTLSFEARATSNIGTTFGILIRPDDISVKYPGDGSTELPEAGFGITLDYHPASPAILLGSANETRIELKGATISLDVDHQSSGLEVVLEGMLKGLTVVLVPGQADGFIQKMMGGEEQRIDIPIGIRWSNISGLTFTGSGGFEIETHPHLEIGPIVIESVQLRLTGQATPSPALMVEAGVSITGELGPLTFMVQGIGLELKASFNGGNAGPFGIDIGFKPPTGIGLSIDAQGFTGGGFLFFDNEKGEYAGGLEIEFQDTIALRAIGVLNTKMPDGTDGFSLVLIITADFTPIQLGYGFTLNGVGGLIGINRTCMTDILQAGVKDGTLNSILFPTDIVANAARIVNDIKRVFPVREGQHVFGPMAKIGWGTPTLITIELGLLIEMPDPVRIAILGVLKTLLPDENFKLLSLQVNFLGVIDFEKKAISFDASLYQSKLLTFTLTGDMALRLTWGDNPVFLLSAGGFHPSYEPPPDLGLGKMERIGFSLFPGNNPRLRVETYFAVTSNTAQFGANGQLYVSKAGFEVEGYVGFDVLFQFSPFYFIALIKASLAVSYEGEELFSVNFSLTLDGPTPWHAKGEASFRVIVKIKVPINETFGSERNTTLEPVDVLPLIIDALKKKDNWKATLPSNSNLMVTLRDTGAGETDIIVHPIGALTITQKIAPLGLSLDKYGNQSIDGVNKFTVTEAKIGTPVSYSYVKDEFAKAQYFKMTDEEKLTEDDFTQLDAGVTIGGSTAANADYVVQRIVEYELKYLRKKRTLQFLRIPLTIFTEMLKGNATGRSKISAKTKAGSAIGTAEVKVAPGQFAITNTRDMQLFGEAYVFNTELEAKLKMRELVKQKPLLGKQIQVVPTYEMNA